MKYSDILHQFHGYPTVRLLNILFNTHIKSVEGHRLSLMIVHDLQVYLANLALNI